MAKFEWKIMAKFDGISRPNFKENHGQVWMKNHSQVWWKITAKFERKSCPTLKETLNLKPQN
jgi:hypothetical protein